MGRHPGERPISTGARHPLAQQRAREQQRDGVTHPWAHRTLVKPAADWAGCRTMCGDQQHPDCTWCSSAALPSGCFHDTEAKLLPALVYNCGTTTARAGEPATPPPARARLPRRALIEPFHPVCPGRRGAVKLLLAWVCGHGRAARPGRANRQAHTPAAPARRRRPLPAPGPSRV